MKKLISIVAFLTILCAVIITSVFIYPNKTRKIKTEITTYINCIFFEPKYDVVLNENFDFDNDFNQKIDAWSKLVGHERFSTTFKIIDDMYKRDDPRIISKVHVMKIKLEEVTKRLENIRRKNGYPLSGKPPESLDLINEFLTSNTMLGYSYNFEPLQKDEAKEKDLRIEFSNIDISAIMLFIFFSVMTIIIAAGLGRYSEQTVNKLRNKQDSGLVKAPGHLLIKIAEYLPEKYSKDLTQNVSDIRLEYYEALNDKNQLKAEVILISYKIGISYSVIKWVGGKVKEVMGFVPKKD